jgi:signal transduction histidine kinase
VSHDRTESWWRVIGPWPLQPLAASIITWAFAAGISAGRLSASPEGLQPDSVAMVFARAAVPAAALGITLWLIRRYVPQSSTRLPVYLLSVLSAAFVFVMVRLALGDLAPAGNLTLGVALIVAMLRNVPIVLLIQAIIGLANRRLAREVERTQAALALAREQQRQMLDADERVRGQVSALLHDRVQAGLIAACLELADAAAHTDLATRVTIDGAVQRLEDLRALDVRGAARALSPDLANTDFQSAMDDLARQYAPAMNVTVEIDPLLASRTSTSQEQVLLGCFRIVEQALLNAAVHGRARNCHVRVEAHDAVVEVRVQDDGSGPGVEGPPGLGSALMTTWTSMLDGSWGREAVEGGGTVVQATLRGN